MASFSLDDIRAAADKKFGNTDITVGDTVVILANALQLPKAKREALTKLGEQLGDDDSDQAEVLRDALRTAATDAKAVEVLIKEVGDNLAVLLQIFTSYNEGTQLGEA